MASTHFFLELLRRPDFICRSCLSKARSFSPLPMRSWSRQYARVPRGQAMGAAASDPLSSANHQFDMSSMTGGDLGRYVRPESKHKPKVTIQDDEDDYIESQLNDLEMHLSETEKIFKMMGGLGLKDKARKLKRKYETRREVTGSPPQISWDPGASSSQRYHVGQLNTFLRNVNGEVSTGNLKPKTISSMWKYYSLARRVLATAWERVPGEVWEMLWRILADETVENVNRMEHIHHLSKDMFSAGVSLNHEQQMLAIEAMFQCGLKTQAIENWRRLASLPGSSAKIFRIYWELGVRMYCQAGDVQRAEKAAESLFASPDKIDPRILFPLIRLCLQKADTEEKAWRFYRRLREMLGDSMQIGDYDEVIGAFLETHRTEFGLQAFVDMMLSDSIDIRAKEKLPLTVGNQFFLGKWLKRLIGAGDLDGAVKVIKYAQERRIVIAPIQVNGLIGAWLRSDNADNIQKAEDLAKSMIRARLLFVNLRERRARFEAPIRLSMAKATEETTLGYVPRATLETFSLMAENYRRRGLDEELQRLWAAFRKAEMAPNAFMMNQLVESYVRNNESTKAVDFYRNMTEEHHVTPDAYTFFSLYKTLAVNRLIILSDDMRERDTVQCRLFFRDLVKSAWSFDSEAIFDQLPRSILHSFLKLRDYAGMFVACRAMRDLFSLAPSQALLVEVAAGSTAVSNESKSRKQLKILMDATVTVEQLLEERQAELERRGQTLENTSPGQRAFELCSVLEKLILRKAEAQGVVLQAETYENIAREMGIYDIVVTRNPNTIGEHRKISPSTLSR